MRRTRDEIGGVRGVKSRPEQVTGLEPRRYPESDPTALLREQRSRAHWTGMERPEGHVCLASQGARSRHRVCRIL